MKLIKTITLAEWVAKINEQTRAFELYWKSLHNDDPENYPVVLPEGDWEEQFDFFVEEV